MTPDFFPKDRIFWWYHGTALLGAGAVQSVFILLWRPYPLVDLVSSLLWVPLFTLAVLVFRYQYRQGRWHRLKVGRLIGISLASVLLIALSVAATNLLLTLTLFWDTLFGGAETDVNIPAVVAQVMFNNTVSTAMFASVWVFLYIGITGKRRIHQAELDKLKLENRLKESRLGELARQLNPHFLFNSLNNIRFTLHECPIKADEAITALSDILRYSLSARQMDKVALSEEFEVVDQYLKVVALQMESRLSVSVAVPDSVFRSLIPPMTLQPLVENAIKHGIEPSRQSGLVELSADIEKGSLRLTVRNTLPPIEARRPSGMGTGLSNLEQRLKLLYDDRAHMILDQTPNYFSISLLLPWETI